MRFFQKCPLSSKLKLRIQISGSRDEVFYLGGGVVLFCFHFDLSCFSFSGVSLGVLQGVKREGDGTLGLPLTSLCIF